MYIIILCIYPNFIYIKSIIIIIIIRYFNQVRKGLIQLSSESIQPPNPSIVPAEILEKEGILYPYFQDAIGPLEGTHIPAKVLAQDVTRFRNRKGEITQNVLGICTFSLSFAGLVPGWEGSAHDGRVLQWALENGFYIPEGKYFLADAGYALKRRILTPYRGVRYHLREQAIAKLR